VAPLVASTHSQLFNCRYPASILLATDDDAVFERSISACGQFSHGESLRPFNQPRPGIIGWGFHRWNFGSALGELEGHTFGLDPRGNRDEMVCALRKITASLFNRSKAALIFAEKPLIASRAFGFVTGIMRFRLFHRL
jgi:hypothetical protein